MRRREAYGLNAYAENEGVLYLEDCAVVVVTGEVGKIKLPRQPNLGDVGDCAALLDEVASVAHGQLVLTKPAKENDPWNLESLKEEDLDLTIQNILWS